MTEMTGHPYKLRQIGLRDFKSVAEADVELGPLTVVVGANSSGKSTLLQAILALAQAFRSHTANAELPLNGDFVNLGTFDDTKNFLSDQSDNKMNIAFRLADSWHHPTQKLSDPLFAARRLRSDGERASLPLVVTLDWRAHLECPIDRNVASSGFATIESLHIAIESVELESGDQTVLLVCDVDDLTADSEDSDSVVSFSKSRQRMAHSTLAARGLVQDWDSKQSYQVDAVVLEGKLPVGFMRSAKKLDAFARIWWRNAASDLQEAIEQQRAAMGQEVVEREPELDVSAVERAYADIDSLNPVPEFGDPDSKIDLSSELDSWDGLRSLFYQLSSSLEPLDRLDKDQRDSIVQSMLELGEDQFCANLRDKLEVEGWTDQELLVEVFPQFRSFSRLRSPSYILNRVVWGASRFFRYRVRYLGPLREAPRVNYPLSQTRLDLGTMGENTANVLHGQPHRAVVMPNENDGERRQLSEALNYWLSEFELAESAHTEGRGRMGIGLTVIPTGLDREVDLTSVGVGVSQVIPVLLLCLLAEPGTLVVLEQPELHLHPRLEQKLADFLLACTRSGRQLIIETHSEHLVNRLRYHIASDPTDDTHNLIKLIFAESEGGITEYREPEINPYGGIGDDWPAGFLDLSARGAQDLVRESLMKRKRG